MTSKTFGPLIAMDEVKHGPDGKFSSGAGGGKGEVAKNPAEHRNDYLSHTQTAIEHDKAAKSAKRGGNNDLSAKHEYASHGHKQAAGAYATAMKTHERNGAGKISESRQAQRYSAVANSRSRAT